MKRDGTIDLSTGQIVAIVLLCVFVLVVGYGVYHKSSFFIFTAKLIPGFNYTEPTDGMSIVGLNLEKDELQYYTGESWRKIELSKGSFVLGDYEFNPKNFKDSLNDFYFNAERRPGQLRKEVNNWRYWDVQIGNFIYETPFRPSSGDFGLRTEKYVLRIAPHTKSSFLRVENMVEPNEFIFLDLLDRPFVRDNYDVPSTTSNSYSYKFARTELEFNQQLIEDVLSWRNSIFEGNSCEKFLTLSFNKNKVGSTKNYAVRKIDQYVLIDLDKPVFEGKAQAWDNPDCYDTNQYFDENKEFSIAGVNVELRYTEYDGSNNKERLTWTGSKNWNYEGQNQDSYSSLRSGSFYQFISMLMSKGTIFDNLDVAFNYERNDEGIFVNNSKKSINLEFIKGKEFDELTDDERNKLIYLILNEYYKNFIFKGEIN